MDPTQHKIYHDGGFHSRTFLNTYFANKPGMAFEEEFLKRFMEELHYFFKFANIKGGTLIDISIGPIIYHLYSACEYFKEIILLRFNEHCIIELQKWLHDRTGAFDWTHTLSFITEKEGSSAQLEEKDLRLKDTVKHVLKGYVDRENIIDPLELPPADCLLVINVLDVISRDKDDFIRNLKKITKLLKPGGQLLLYGVLNATYYTVGEHTFHILNYDENFIRKAVEGEGYVIKHCHVRPRTSESDLTDFKTIIFISACKN
ncbi:PREDICTED: indolethylamine N-methyltransferase-like [Nanorana parkeri]|uniref:indolethylamine N-methyltransferase-like n=1 Tax=Nanorana parkeri TaxID=125878 RepID=UPI0008547F73|nr:PREDICTED: indolethylamine N-methyltransferase-like [Nanorana parkeri]